jgi:hypothetical protein
MSAAPEFLKRLSENSEHRATVEIVFGAVGRFAAAARDTRADARLSPKGVAEKVAAMAQDGPIKFMAELRRRQDDDRRKLDARFAEFEFRPPDPHHLDPEIRTFLRGLAPGEAARFALADPRFASAILGAPKELSGVDEELFGRIRQSELERQHGSELAILNREADDLDVVDAALRVAHQQLLSEAGLNTNKGNTINDEAKAA